MSTAGSKRSTLLSKGPEAGGKPADCSLVESGPTALDRVLGGPMFGVTVLFLLLLGGSLHLGTEASLVGAVHEAGFASGAKHTPDALAAHQLSLQIGRVCTWCVLCLYPLFVFESVWHWRRGAQRVRQHAWFVLLPPLRLGARDHARGEWIWLPCIGWAEVNDALRRRVERGASTPMLIVALAVLPLLAAQHYLSEHLQHSRWLLLASEAGAALIWTAFTFEFIVMVSIARNRWKYAREHWLDLLIICFPLVAFLRALRLAGLLRASRLARTLQVFRLRGTMMRLWKAVLLLELLDRTFNRPEKRLNLLRERLALKEFELAELKREIAELELRLAQAQPTMPRENPSGVRMET